MILDEALRDPEMEYFMGERTKTNETGNTRSLIHYVNQRLKAVNRDFKCSKRMLQNDVAYFVQKGAKRAKASVSCASLMLDKMSRSDTIPGMDIRTNDADIGHEAKIGRISDDAIFYLMSRGIPEEEARAMIVSGFAEPISKELPLEYAVEMNNLIKLEMEGTL